MYQQSQHSNDLQNIFHKETIVNILLSYTQEEQTQVKDTNEQEKHTKLFLDFFGTSIAEYSNYNSSEKGRKLFQRSCTISDEAFGIFTIERCWSTWLKEMTHNFVSPPRSSEYTRKNSNKKCGGWTEIGLKHFSKIAQMVAESRESNQRKNVEERYRLSHLKNVQCKEKTHFDNPEGSENQIITELPTFIPYNDFPDILDDPSVDDTMNTEKSGKYHVIYFFTFSKHMITNHLCLQKIDTSIQISTSNIINNNNDDDDDTADAVERTKGIRA